jgi:hypothetical protein
MKRALTADQQKIASFAWDCTVGAGNVGDDAPGEPDGDAVLALARFLKRPLTCDDLATFCTAWVRCEQQAAQP